jgi:hypothetical protein
VRAASAIVVAIALLGTGCTEKRVDDRAPPPARPPDPQLAEAKEAYRRSIADHASWRPSSEPCPVKMNPLPPAKPGQNLGRAALAEGPREGRLNTNVVRSFEERNPITRVGDAVEVLYVETSRVNPVPDPTTQTYRPGISKGVAYVWDAAQSRFACMADVNARSSSTVTSLGKDDKSAAMWMALDLMFAIEREVADHARAIARLDMDAGADSGRDAGAIRRSK